ncbi:MAG: tRNA glutamyl-Q(34) synthetase GluQRS [SAR86 cluster bacterium]|uniref:Glutamyl-Q tRNA(Asp) synthetase n=1 Tax=SAR86 cluster bacterium TaxID=2030880 RepID=A0A2A4WYK9_9GAMM|nr:MAG: tRNA glutamyl-Q(34) synthetase GluQRS [SAR86 cluster bacterium]
MQKPSASQIDTESGLGYIGRFAPSPTGPLHFGSLLAALASFLDARANQGKWLMRVEDLDPPREPAGSAELILQQLLDLGMDWDDEVLYQSSRLEAYEEVLHKLQDESLCYPCDCTRPQIREMGLVYNGSCRERGAPPEMPYALRLKTDALEIGFDDEIQGHFAQQLEVEVGDFVIRRKDELFAYQLAVVVDDELQNITHVVRGWDLLDSTPRQIYLQRVLNYRPMSYAHIPIIVDERGQKLSKQAFAPSIETDRASDAIYKALTFLGQAPPAELEKESAEAQLQWAIASWDIRAVAKVGSLPLN